MERITEAELAAVKKQIQPLIGSQFKSLALPLQALEAFEPSQVGTIVGSLMDALIPHLPDLPEIGLKKHAGITKDREGYPDYQHSSGKRLELKLLYVHNPKLKMKTTSTPREPSARLSQSVTMRNVDPANDAMLVIAYRMEPQEKESAAVSPKIIDLEVLSMIELVEARDKRMEDCGGKWFDNSETPTIPSKRGKAKLKTEVKLDETVYGQKESEGKDFNKDTNFGKLRRIPHAKLQAFLDKHKASTIKVDEETRVPSVVKELEKTIDEMEEK